MLCVQETAARKKKTVDAGEAVVVQGKESRGMVYLVNEITGA